jgi:hypothetical protein
VSRTLRRSDVGDFLGGGAVQEMEDCWPSGVGLRGQTSNHPVLRWLKTVVVSDQGNDATGSRQVGSGKTCQKCSARPVAWSGVAVEASKAFQMASKPGVSLAPRDEPGGCPCIGQVVPGVEAA